jgi:hypothetical protein
MANEQTYACRSVFVGKTGYMQGKTVGKREGKNVWSVYLLKLVAMLSIN